MFNKQKTVGIVLSYATMALNILVVLFYKPFLLKKVGVSEFGINSISMSLVSLVSLLDLGFSQSLIRFISKYRALNDEKSQSKLIGLFLRLYSLISLLGLFVGTTIIKIYPLISKGSLTAQEMILFKQVFVILLINVIFTFPLFIFSSIVNAYEEFTFYKSISLVGFILKYVCIIIALVTGYRIVAVTIISVIISLLTYLSYLIFCFRKLHIKISFEKLNRQEIQPIISYSFIIFFNSIIDFLYANTDKILLSSLIGTTAVTVYEFGVCFASFFTELSTSISSFFMPEIVKIYDTKKDINSLSNIFDKVSKIQLYILLLFLSGYLAFGKEFIVLWIGEEYIESYYIGVIIMTPAIVPLTQNVGISIIRAMNLHKYRSYMYLVIAVINVIISIPLSIRYGAIGAAIGTCVGTILGQIIFMNIFYSKVVKIDIKKYWINFLKNISIICPILIITKIIKEYVKIANYYSLVIYALIYTVIYVVIIYLFIYKKERKIYETKDV